MLQKPELQQLRSLSLDDVKSYKEKATKRKAELEALKAKGGKAWTANLQDELDNVVLFLVDVDDVIEEKAPTVKPQAEKSQADAPTVKPQAGGGYVVKPGTEKMVHLRIVRGRRFNPMTGKEESPAYVQTFTFSEWQLFKKAYKGLGYTIIKALHDPYGDAADFEQK